MAHQGKCDFPIIYAKRDKLITKSQPTDSWLSQHLPNCMRPQDLCLLCQQAIRHSVYTKHFITHDYHQSQLIFFGSLNYKQN